MTRASDRGRGSGAEGSLEQMRVARRARDLAVRLRSVRALARRFGAHLLALGADRVWLFGSALDGGRFAMTSDVDVAVEGLRAEQFLAAYRDGMDSAIPVDLLDISEAHPELAERIRRKGRPIVERPWRRAASTPRGAGRVRRRGAAGSRLRGTSLQRATGYLEEARRGSEAAMLGTVKALENVSDAFEDLARRIETTFTAMPQGAEWQRELLAGLARPRAGLRPAVLDAGTVRVWDDFRAFRHFGRHRVYRNGASPRLGAEKVAALPAATLRLRVERFLAAVDREIRALE